MELIIKDDFKDIIENPDNYPEEMLATALDYIDSINRQLKSQIYESKKKLEYNIKKRMIESGATKLIYINPEGEQAEKTLLSGTWQPDRNAKEIYENAGFDPYEIGKDEFKPVWSMAKKAMKVGGKKKEIIERIFTEGDKKLK